MVRIVSGRVLTRIDPWCRMPVLIEADNNNDTRIIRIISSARLSWLQFPKNGQDEVVFLRNSARTEGNIRHQNWTRSAKNIHAYTISRTYTLFFLQSVLAKIAFKICQNQKDGSHIQKTFILDENPFVLAASSEWLGEKWSPGRLVETEGEVKQHTSAMLRDMLGSSRFAGGGFRERFWKFRIPNGYLFMTILSLIYFDIQRSTHEWTDRLIYFEWFWFWDRHDDHDSNDGTLHHFTFLRPSLARSTETSPKVDPVWPCTDQKSGWVALSRRAFEIFETREDRKMWWNVHASAASGKKTPWNMAHSACSLCLSCQCFAVKTWRLVFKWVEHEMLFECHIDLYTVPVHISTTLSSVCGDLRFMPADPSVPRLRPGLYVGDYAHALYGSFGLHVAHDMWLTCAMLAVQGPIELHVEQVKRSLLISRSKLRPISGWSPAFGLRISDTRWDTSWTPGESPVGSNHGISRLTWIQEANAVVCRMMSHELLRF